MYLLLLCDLNEFQEGSTAHDIQLNGSLLLQAQSSPAHTMDRFLPQKLQEAAAAATAARAKAAGTAAKSELQQESSAAGEADNNPGIFANFARDTALPSRPSPVASPSTLPKHASVAAPQFSRPYYTPMPVDIKPAGIKPKRAILQQDHEVNSSKVGLGIPSNGYLPPIEITDDIGQIEEGMEFLAVGGTDRADDDDLEAPSSFCCPITTVSNFMHKYYQHCCTAHIAGQQLQSTKGMCH